MVVEFLNNILGTHRHMNKTCIAERLNQTDLWFGVNCILKVGGVTLY